MSLPVTCRADGWHAQQLDVEKPWEDFPDQVDAPDLAKIEAVCLGEAVRDIRTLHDLHVALDALHIAQVGMLGMDQAPLHINAVRMGA